MYDKIHHKFKKIKKNKKEVTEITMPFSKATRAGPVRQGYCWVQELIIYAAKLCLRMIWSVLDNGLCM